MNSYPVDLDYPTFLPNSDHSAFVAHAPIASGLVYPEPFPLQSQELYDYSDDLGQFPVPEDSFVSPVTYDPASGMYIQTFPEEHAEFLRQYGQRFDIPESGNSQEGEWSYYDAQTSRAQLEQPSGFHYNVKNHSTPPEAHEAYMSSPASNDDGASMLQYMASPTPAFAQVHHQYVDNVIAPAALYNGVAALPNVPHYQQATRSAPIHEIQEELIQPHMIVPSQHALGGFMEELRRRELPVEIRSRCTSGGPSMNHLPMQDPVTSIAAITAQAPEELRQEQLWDMQMNGQTSGHPVHDLHPVPPEAASPSVSSPESDDSHSHSHSYSPKGKLHAVSRGWSPHRRSPSPRASSLGVRLSPLPHNRKVSADADKRPTLACLFCRGRKIACGPPLPGSTDKSCNQCARRHLKCEYPTESRRGMRRRHKTTTSDKVKSAKVAVKGPRKRATR